MGSGRYKKFGLLYGIVIILLFVMLLVFLFSGEGTGMGGMITFSPYPNPAFDSIFIILLTIGTAIVGAMIGGYLLAPLFLFAQKNTIGRNMVYGIQETSKSEKFKKAFIKSLFPALLALNFALMLSTNAPLQGLLLTEGIVESGMGEVMMISALFPIMGALCMGLFSPVWFLQDGGIVYSNKEKARITSDPLEIRSVGGWYLYILKGYAGISVIVNFYTFLSNLLSTQTSFGGQNMLLLIIWPVMPFLIAFLYMPGIMVLDMTYEKRRKFMINMAEKLGITQKVERLTF